MTPIQLCELRFLSDHEVIKWSAGERARHLPHHTQLGCSVCLNALPA